MPVVIEPHRRPARVATRWSQNRFFAGLRHTKGARSRNIPHALQAVDGELRGKGMEPIATSAEPRVDRAGLAAMSGGAPLLRCLRGGCVEEGRAARGRR